MNSLRPVLIAVLVVTEVALWQWRMVLAHRGRRVNAMLLGFIGAVLQITAITQVVTDVHDLLSVAAYAGGVGFGVLFGIIAGERLTPGRLEVTIVSTLVELSEYLWRRGWAVTAQQAHNQNGPVVTVHIEIERRDEAQLWDDMMRIDPLARWTAKDVRTGTFRNPEEGVSPTRVASATAP